MNFGKWENNTGLDIDGNPIKIENYSRYGY